MGSISITQYRYDICVYREGGVNKVITDIVSQVTVSSASSVHLLDYKANMNANVSNMSVIGQSYLNSQSSTTYTLSGGIGVNGNVISGNINGSTSNTYSANNQNITNHFLKQKIKEWWCDPTKNWKGASWELEPAIRIRNNNASSWKTRLIRALQTQGGRRICSLDITFQMPLKSGALGNRRPIFEFAGYKTAPRAHKTRIAAACLFGA